MLFHQKAKIYQEPFRYPLAQLSDFSNESFILLDKSQKAYSLITGLGKQAGFTIKEKISCPTFNSAHALLLSGIAPTFIPDLYIEFIEKAKQDLYYTIAPFFPSRQVYLFYDQEAEKNPIKKAFLQAITSGSLF
ncbi:MAG: LysR family transcriptional regulator substrate-binding protein [Clostridiales bacterium]|nr:LysR family transcriptional regulator substrate-binding protein [Clostridiales bacterium]